MKTLVAYFTAEYGKTASFARLLSENLKADLTEIKPDVPYSKEDVDWRIPASRCNEEHRTGCDVPFSLNVDSVAGYDRVLIGFPIWYGCAPNIINTFCKAYDFSGKTVILFATSGGGGLGSSLEKLLPYLPGAEVKDIRLLRTPQDVEGWPEA